MELLLNFIVWIRFFSWDQCCFNMRLIKAVMEIWCSPPPCKEKKKNLSEQTPDIIGCAIRNSRLKTVAAAFQNPPFLWRQTPYFFLGS